MPRPKLNKEKMGTVAGQVKLPLKTAFQYLCVQLGIPEAEALRRLVVRAVRDKEIPGVSFIELNDDELNAAMPFAHTKDPKKETAANSNDSEGEVLYERPK